MMKSTWECPLCKKKVRMDVEGTQQVSHRCPKTLKPVNFVRVDKGAILDD